MMIVRIAIVIEQLKVTELGKGYMLAGGQASMLRLISRAVSGV